MPSSAGGGARRFGGAYRLRFQGQNVSEGRNWQKENQISLFLSEYWSPGTRTPGSANKTRLLYACMPSAFVGSALTGEAQTRVPNLKTLEALGANGNAIDSSELVRGWVGRSFIS